MATYLDEALWQEAFTHPDWYLRIKDDRKRLEALAAKAQKQPVHARIKEEMYSTVENALNENKIILAKQGTDLDVERQPIDYAVIHHTKNKPGMSLQRLNATQLLRIYATYYADPTDPREKSFKGHPVWSGHFYKSQQVFWGYHWLVREDGSCEHILEDSSVGWQASNVQMPCTRGCAVLPYTNVGKTEVYMADDNLAARAGEVRLGNLTVYRMGLGTNRITDTPQSRELLLRAVELGVNFIDTAHRYGSGASEAMIGKSLPPYPKGLVITTKGGFNYDGEAGSPDELRKDLEESLRLLKTDCIDLYQLHRVDPKVPLEESVAALKQFQDEGKIRHIGLSEVTIEQLEAAQKVAPIVSVQNEYNVLKRQHEALIDYCTEHEVVFIPWFPLGGLDGGAQKVAAMLEEIAHKYQATPQQIALAWLLKRSPIMLPIPGTLSIEHLETNLRSATVELNEEDCRQLTGEAVV